MRPGKLTIFHRYGRQRIRHPESFPISNKYQFRVITSSILRAAAGGNLLAAHAERVSEEIRKSSRMLTIWYVKGSLERFSGCLRCILRVGRARESKNRSNYQINPTRSQEIDPARLVSMRYWDQEARIRATSPSAGPGPWGTCRRWCGRSSPVR